ncbi:MAG: polysaccharide deacetylase family protein [Saprospiraceae bacterium]|nr:polysaccharide deacetylase family protein [Saprospiraceae bacterium]
MYLVKTPKWLQILMPAYLWRLSEPGKNLYLTFDDGPIPEVTPWVLDQLRKYQARATFFCVGENVKRHQSVYRRVLAEGHSVGNHTYNHLNGWHTPPPDYLNNIRRCARLVDSPLFRPPYGRLRPRQRAALEAHFQLVMWDVLSGDFDPNISPVQCLDNVVQAAEPGSIIVFHDSLKSYATLRAVLPETLRIFSEKGYRFEALPMQRRHAVTKPRIALRAV